jgi:hypothetical protein
MNTAAAASALQTPGIASTLRDSVIDAVSKSVRLPGIGEKPNENGKP